MNTVNGKGFAIYRLLVECRRRYSIARGEIISVNSGGFGTPALRVSPMYAQKLKWAEEVPAALWRLGYDGPSP